MAQPPEHPPNAPQHLPGKPPAKPSGFKASKAITLTGIGVVSLLLVSACSARQNYEEVGAECVDLNSRQADGTYKVVDENLCDDTRYRGSRGAYGWYYGGLRSGTRIRQGTTVRPADVGITSGKGTVIQRGGFGGRGGSGGGS